VVKYKGEVSMLALPCFFCSHKEVVTMPYITLNNAHIYYEDSAPNESRFEPQYRKPVMLFAHGLLWGTPLFDKQVAYFQSKYRCIAFDFRGQGQSEVTKDGYDMDSLADDAIALLEALDIDKCHFIGLSMGGFVGQRVAIRRPDLLKSLILLETSADAEDPKKAVSYNKLMRAISWLGIRRVSKKVMPIMFGKTFLSDRTRREEYQLWLSHLNSNSKKGAIHATRGVIQREEVLSKLGDITTPTLILVGDEDVATPYDKAQRIHFAIQGSKLAVIQRAGHTSTVEEPEQVNHNIEWFLSLLD